MKNKNSGFTLVEILVASIILVILLAIGIPVMLNILNNSSEAEIALDAKNIWIAVQNSCNNQLANDEHWSGKGRYNNSDFATGLIINEFSVGLNEEFRNNFDGLFTNIQQTEMGKNILSKLENFDNFTSLYIGIGNFNKYFFGEDYRNAYTLYIIAFKYKDDNKMYYYNGKEVLDKWPFNNFTLEDYTPNKILTMKLNKKDTIYLQFYSLINKDNPGSSFIEDCGV